jgi:hypothetical protein
MNAHMIEPPLLDRGSLLSGLYFGATSRASRNGFVRRAERFRSRAGTGCRAARETSEGPAWGKRGPLKGSGDRGDHRLRLSNAQNRKRFKQQRRASGICSLGGVELFTEVPQILQLSICLCKAGSGSTCWLRRLVAASAGNEQPVPVYGAGRAALCRLGKQRIIVSVSANSSIPNSERP